MRAHACSVVPVVRLSINAARSVDYHLQLGAKLAALRERGVLVIGSGNVVHNLRAMDWQTKDAGLDWARRFNDKAIEMATSTPDRVPALVQDADFAMAAPTPEHFLPFVYVAGVAAGIGEPLSMLIDGYTYDSLSMTCFVVGAPCPISTALAMSMPCLAATCRPKTPTSEPKVVESSHACRCRWPCTQRVL